MHVNAYLNLHLCQKNQPCCKQSLLLTTADKKIDIQSCCSLCGWLSQIPSSKLPTENEYSTRTTTVENLNLRIFFKFSLKPPLCSVLKPVDGGHKINLSPANFLIVNCCYGT